MNFTMDLNSVISACTCVNPDTGQRDFDCLTIMLVAPDRGHVLVITKEMERSYIGIFESQRPVRIGPDNLVASKAYFYARANGRVDNERTSLELPPLRDEESIKDEDLPFARLVILTGGLLVTFDGPLRERLPANSAIPRDAKNRLT